MTEQFPIPYGRQFIDDDDIAAVIQTLRGDFLTGGPDVREFEEAVSSRVQARHAVAFSNATAGLHACVAVAGLGPGDLIATSSLTFVASANCAKYVGAEVILVDIDPATLNVDVEQIPEEADALVAVHFGGLPVDLSSLSTRPRIIIEDAAQALGAWTPDGPVGNCARSDMTCFSFHPVKPVTTGEGGVVTTNSTDLAEKLRRFRSHGTQPVPERGGWYYEVVDEGFNYRLTDIQAALGKSQLKKLDGFIARRQELAARYDEMLRDLPVTTAPRAPSGFGHGYHLYTIRTQQRREVYERLRERGIFTQVHYVPVHHHPRFEYLNAALPATDKAYEGLLTLPLFPLLSDAEQDHVVHELRTVLTELNIGD